MKRYCPSCRYHWAWKLNDGRFKCRRCGCRYTFRSVWKASRLPDRTKQDLLNNFAQGEISAINTSSPHIRDRFIQLSRMTLAFHEHYCEPFIGSMVPRSAVVSANDNIPGTDLMVLGIRQQEDHIRVFPVFGPDAQRLVDLLCKTTGTNGLYYTADRHAYGVVAIQNNAIVAHTAQKNGTDPDNVIELFWHEVSSWLTHYQRIPIERFHLFIGEVSFRFHYRDQELFPLMLERVRQTPTHELKNM